MAWPVKYDITKLEHSLILGRNFVGQCQSGEPVCSMALLQNGCNGGSADQGLRAWWTQGFCNKSKGTSKDPEDFCVRS